MPEKVQKQSLIKEGDYTVVEVKELAFFDMTGEKAKTQGTSNKSYHAELQAAKTGDKCQIYTVWGPTGASNQTKEWRHYTSRIHADKDFGAIIKSKTSKGYRIIDVAQRAQGSEAAKAIIKPVILNDTPTSLDPNIQKLVFELFNITNTWVETKLSCPLGQLTNSQIEKGRDLLNQIKQILISSQDDKKIQQLTNDFYGEIPHNLGQGSRGQMNHLLLNNTLKIAQKDQDLDDLLNAKSLGVAAASKDVNKQYISLNTKYQHIDHSDYEFSWIQDLMENTKAANHYHLGKIILLDAWKMKREKEEEFFLENAEKIASQCGKQTISDIMKKLVSSKPKLGKELDELYIKSNTLPLWHGTRSSNLIGIIKNGLLIKPSGAIINGSAYGDGVYFGYCSKSVNYTDIQSSYWAKGQNDTAFMFLVDVALGNQKIAPKTNTHHYSIDNIKPYHSVWAKGGVSGVINDEYICYLPAGKQQQFRISHIIKFTCQK